MDAIKLFCDAFDAIAQHRIASLATHRHPKHWLLMRFAVADITLQDVSSGEPFALLEQQLKVRLAAQNF